jgi:AcrR family transcriptional regulator
MARTVGSSGAKTADAIRAAGVSLIYRHGFEAMSLRQLAAEVGLQPGSLYKYFDTKQGLLFDIVRDHMETLLRSLGEALEGVDGPEDRLQAFAAFHLRYHMRLKELVFIAQSEIRSLDPDNRAAVVALRRRYEAVLEEILAAGRAAGRFRDADVHVTAFAILAMLTGICQWYRPDGRMGEEELVATHVALVMDGVKA